MTTYARKPLPIDGRKSRLWALAGLGSAGVGPVGFQLFDLVNRETGRGHQLELDTLGLGLSIPISGSYGASDYVSFKTPHDVNFFDFDGLHMTVRETNAGLYGWTTVSFWKMSVRLSGGGLNIPGLSVATGIAKVLFGSGKPRGIYEVLLRAPDIPGIFEEDVKVVQQDDVLVRRISGDALFGYNQYLLKSGQRTENMLTLIGNSLHKKPDFEFHIVGHTDSIGSRAYNQMLSKRRAETVAQWLITHNYAQPGWIKIVGAGESEPVASNATKEGRELNRRVEVYEVRTSKVVAGQVVKPSLRP